jgi:hypothetical protein
MTPKELALKVRDTIDQWIMGPPSKKNFEDIAEPIIAAAKAEWEETAVAQERFRVFNLAAQPQPALRLDIAKVADIIHRGATEYAGRAGWAEYCAELISELVQPRPAPKPEGHDAS